MNLRMFVKKIYLIEIMKNYVDITLRNFAYILENPNIDKLLYSNVDNNIYFYDN